ncbi:MAG: 30S ribosomal protein S12 methylthiotransferase RimO [Proteobacteria bacterium]|nr:30S ribosomal protein S12 methylthiotransferase RimO [Pseudomonadota bacterium]NBS06947.1 30S ribosomal protein S12 methylthiotransferase RimO [Verrucomicrobiota bacterium]NBS49849.1 30S ribosomal protein S12 methylthiotransferase RimO [Verrucomicrobiota bacterium]NBS79536.1 30S ribosomal protein S12 methylthiotransferase RimO [bacterium]
MATKVGLISLGCAKNLVDSEIMLGHLRSAGIDLTSDSAEADVLIVNTCAFIDSAKTESISAILEAHRDRGLHRRRADQRLIVAGCMSQRFSTELTGELTEVDAFIGLDQLEEVAPIVRRVLSRSPGAAPENLVPDHLPVYIPDFNTPRWRLTPKHFAYVKIAEGCNHPCSFCVIPQMRGKHRSRTIESIRREAEQLVGEGVKELLLISQDTTYFGMDRWTEGRGPRAQVTAARGENLIGLLEALSSVKGDFWIRLLYTHPAHWSDELIAAIARLPKVARYVDMPLQHVEEGMLRDMRRETSEAHIRDLVKRLRAGIPGLAIRTTFIAGFPGETDAQFETLLGFIEEAKFDRMGIFTYSQEQGSRAAKMDGQISATVKKSRYRKAMAAQQKIAKERAASLVGKKVRVLVDTPDTARTEADAPDVDGKVLLQNPLSPGTFAEVTITGHTIYDLIA